jgi:hypothetical protein
MQRSEIIAQIKANKEKQVCSSSDDGTFTDELFEFSHAGLESYNCKVWHGRVIRLTEEEKEIISSGSWKV